MLSITDLREQLNSAMRRAAAPGTLTVTTKTDTIPRKDEEPEIITYVTLTVNTSTAGACYIAELISQLSEENG